MRRLMQIWLIFGALSSDNWLKYCVGLLKNQENRGFTPSDSPYSYF